MVEGDKTLGEAIERAQQKSEQDQRWLGHDKEHSASAIITDKDAQILAERIAHEKEIRELQESSVEKARQIQFNEYERRLTSLNHAHEQATEAQAKTVPREMFDNYVAESADRMSVALKATNDKYDTAIGNTIKAHSSDMKTMIDRHDTDIRVISKELQDERELRKLFEGSINTWKWIAGFLGVSGVGGVILLFFTRASN